MMWLRMALGVIGGLVLWFVLAFAGDFAIRSFWPAYVAAEPSMAFDLPMKLARLTLSSVSLVLATLALQRIARSSLYAVGAFSVVMLAIFVPIHYGLWTKFPIWYHLFFLSSLAILPSLTVRVAAAATEPMSVAS
jgi:hypothetical protein